MKLKSLKDLGKGMEVKKLKIKMAPVDDEKAEKKEEKNEAKLQKKALKGNVKMSKLSSAVTKAAGARY